MPQTGFAECLLEMQIPLSHKVTTQRHSIERREGDLNPRYLAARRFSKPVLDCPKDETEKDLAPPAPDRCTECCTLISGAEIPPDLIALIDAWPDLPDNIRQAILTLGQLSPKGGR